MGTRAWGRALYVVLCLSLLLAIGIGDGFFAAGFARMRSAGDCGVVINEVLSDNRNLLRDDDGDYSGYIELYNASDAPADLGGFGLTSDPRRPYLWRFPQGVVLGPRRFLVVWASGKDRAGAQALHANFKLKQKDKAVVLTAPDQTWRTVFPLAGMAENIACGRSPDGSAALAWFDGETAGAANTLEPLAPGCSISRLEPVDFSLPGGLCAKDTVLRLSHRDPLARICYTLDGSVPTADSLRYRDGIALPQKENGATVVRARAFRDGYPASPVATETYLVSADGAFPYALPVVSLVVDPSDLFGYETGIYAAGETRHLWQLAHPEAEVTADTPANYNQEGKAWERQAHLELIEPDGREDLSQGIGIRTHGGHSLAQDNKSLQLFARAAYDDRDTFAYDFFPDAEDDPPATAVLLRNSSSDAGKSFFRDAFVQSLADPALLDLQKSRPCIALVNGAYYGIYNLRTQYNEEYLETRYGIAEGDAVILKNPSGGPGDEVQVGLPGDELSYAALYRYIETHDMRVGDAYAYVQTQLDLDNYIEYHILELYCGNEDWPANNVRVWRKRTEAYDPDAPYGSDGRWRFLVYDLDYSYGIHGRSFERDTLAMATAADSRAWNNPPASTMILRSLLANETFRNRFVSRFADLLNTRYSAGAALERLDRLQAVYQPCVAEHLRRWGLYDGAVEGWLAEVRTMRRYAAYRPYYLRRHICGCFGLETADLTVTAGEGGTVRVNSVTVTPLDRAWHGVYFQGVPVSLEAAAAPGFRFVRWEGAVSSDQAALTQCLPASAELRAVFERSGP